MVSVATEANKLIPTDVQLPNTMHDQIGLNNMESCKLKKNEHGVMQNKRVMQQMPFSLTFEISLAHHP